MIGSASNTIRVSLNLEIDKFYLCFLWSFEKKNKQFLEWRNDKAYEARLNYGYQPL